MPGIVGATRRAAASSRGGLCILIGRAVPTVLPLSVGQPVLRTSPRSALASLLLLGRRAPPSPGAVQARPAAPPGGPDAEFEHYALPNGLDVILHVGRELPIVHVNQCFHVGSKNERRGRTGFVHLFEHMM